MVLTHLNLKKLVDPPSDIYPYEEVSLIGDHGGQQWVTGDSTGWDSSPNFASEADTAGPAPIV